MFIGHWAPALVAAAHPKAPRLGILFLAAQLVDWAFFTFVIAGVEHMRVAPGVSVMNPMDLYHMPYTHSLLGGVLWGTGFAAIIYAATHSRAGALIGGGVVVSHWFTDWLVHIPDLTLWGNEPKLGLGLWNHPAVAMPLELGLVAAGFAVLIYVRRPVGRGGWAALALLAAVMMLVQLVNWFGPPPAAPDIGTIGLVFGTYAVITLIARQAGRKLNIGDPAAINQGH